MTAKKVTPSTLDQLTLLTPLTPLDVSKEVKKVKKVTDQVRETVTPLPPPLTEVRLRSSRIQPDLSEEEFEEDLCRRAGGRGAREAFDRWQSYRPAP